MPNTRFSPMKSQKGVMLLEALISLLIFSIGILAIIALQALSINNAGESRSRSDASLLVNQLIGRMWMSDRTQATLAANYSTGGPAYQSWVSDVVAAGTLPNVAAYPPTVTVSSVAGGSASDPATSLVTVTLFWKAPDEPAAAAPHQYIAVTQIR